MFILMDQIKAMIASYLNTAVTTYQEDEIVQEFLDYIQQKVAIQFYDKKGCRILFAYVVIWMICHSNDTGTLQFSFLCK